ncbi:DNA polymerase III subunit chi [Aestuariicella sp. G3-2]|uniref:DNA polymerase III subunit chi n=1 Tax=Pseudomaricurvus albidus TaxID=2842452 RepID=UPI001C0AEE7E|nr:DNA polymerase III subunit chi [Aestuariicella albida]MBU3069480.1 DNA polymerase III subunit chi [Aestuariicella albida]
MTQVDFYVLPAPAVEQRLVFACRLAQKAYQSGSKVFIAVNTAEEAAELNQRLWNFRPESFLPHDCEGDSPLQSQVAVGFGNDCGDHHDLLINLKDAIPDYFSRFQRLAEVVCQDEQVLSATREHYGFYRHRGYPINSHKISQS